MTLRPLTIFSETLCKDDERLTGRKCSWSVKNSTYSILKILISFLKIFSKVAKFLLYYPIFIVWLSGNQYSQQIVTCAERMLDTTTCLYTIMQTLSQTGFSKI
jgi:hypothetical protein